MWSKSAMVIEEHPFTQTGSDIDVNKTNLLHGGSAVGVFGTVGVFDDAYCYTTSYLTVFLCHLNVLVFQSVLYGTILFLRGCIDVISSS